MITVKQLITMLKKYPDTMEITNEQNIDFKHIVNIGDRLIVSTEKPIGTCNRTGEYVYPSIVDGYVAFSPELDEDLYKMEYTSLKEVKRF